MSTSIARKNKICSRRFFFRHLKTNIIDIDKFAEGLIEAVGKPVLKGSMDDYYGSWMHDVTSDKLFVTRNNTRDMSFIYEYKSKEHFKNETGRQIRLPYPFQVGSLKIKRKATDL